MAIYKDMYNAWKNSPTPDKALKEFVGKIKSSAWEGTPGHQIMRRLPSSPTLGSLFDCFTDFGRASDDWVWDPQVGGYKHGHLLDGLQGAGECALFAANFWVLAWAPPPYGLGIDDKKLELWNFTGKHEKGFVAKHDHATIVSPVRANVRLPLLIEAPTTLYLWENHKVVVHEGTVYDPAYGITFARPNYLGKYQIKAKLSYPTPNEDAPKGYVAKPERRSATVSIDDEEYLVAGDKHTRDFLFRVVPESERPNKPYQGPYEFINNKVVPAGL